MNLRTRKSLLTAALLGLVAVSTPALSQDMGWYAGVSFGQSTFKDGCTGLSGTGISCDDTDNAFIISGGYQINRNFGVELGYADLGKVTATLSGQTATIGAKGFELVGVGTFPINQQFDLYGKLGFFNWDLDAKGPAASISEKGTDLTLAFGAKYNFTKNIAMRVQYQIYQDIGKEATTGTTDVDVISVGVVYKF